MFSNTNTTGLFGDTSAAAASRPTTGLFGSSPFGSQAQPQNTTPTSFGSTGYLGTGTTSTSGGFFGSSNQQNLNTGGGLFNTQPSTTPTGIFSTGTSTLQQTTPSLFGSSPTSTGLFGSTNQNTTPGPFGSTGICQDPNAQRSNFLLGQSPTPTGGLFGSTTTNTNTSNLFSSPQITGTKDIRWRDDYNRDTNGRIQAISYLHEVNQQKSLEELRFEDYCLGLLPGKTPNTATPKNYGQMGTTGTFQSPSATGTGLFGAPSSLSTLSPSGGIDGTTAQQSANVGGLFGSTTPSQTPATGGGLFGSNIQPTPSLFGGQNTGMNTSGTSGGLFGSATQNSSTLASTGGLFGSTTQPTTGNSLFGGTGNMQAASPFGGMQQKSLLPTTSGLFGTTTPTLGGSTMTSTPNTGTTGLFGSTTLPPTTTDNNSLFGSKPASFGTGTGTSLFGGTATPNKLQGTNMFGGDSSLFGSAQRPGATTGTGTSSLFGLSSTSAGQTAGTTPSTTPSLFDNRTQASTAPSSSLFGAPSTTLSSLAPPNTLFGTTNLSNQGANKPTSLFDSGTRLFGGGTLTQPTTGTPAGGTSGLFGLSAPTSSLFGTAGTTTPSLFSTQQPSVASNLGSNQQSQPGSLFGSTQQQQQSLVGQQQRPGNMQSTPWNPTQNAASDGIGTALAGSSSVWQTLNQLSTALPSSFNFPPSGVILPTHYRRYKSATFAQLLKPLPEYVMQHRRQPLPSLTPKRMYLSSGNQQRINNLHLTPHADENAKGWSTPTLMHSAYHPGNAYLGDPHDASFNNSLSTSSRKHYLLTNLLRQHEDYAMHSAPRTYRNKDNSLTPIQKQGAQTTQSHFVSTRSSPQQLQTNRTPTLNSTHKKSVGMSSYSANDGTPVIVNNGAYLDKSHRGLGNDEDAENDRSQDDGKESTTPIWLSQSQLRKRLLKEQGSQNRNFPQIECLSDRSGSAQSMPSSYQRGSLARHTGKLKLNREAFATSAGELGINQSSYAEQTEKSVAPICTREGYSTRPSIETLRSLPESRLAAIEDFTVIKEDCGEITWPGLTDVRYLNLDEIVNIQEKIVEVYPDDYLSRTGEQPPPVGVGLNKPACITLFNCATKSLLNSPEELTINSPIYQENVKRIKLYTEKMNAQFISYSPQGVWKFRVEHFSRYGFLDEENQDQQLTGGTTVITTGSQSASFPNGCFKPDFFHVIDDQSQFSALQPDALSGFFTRSASEEVPFQFSECFPGIHSAKHYGKLFLNHSESNSLRLDHLMQETYSLLWNVERSSSISAMDKIEDQIMRSLITYYKTLHEENSSSDVVWWNYNVWLVCRILFGTIPQWTFYENTTQVFQKLLSCGHLSPDIENETTNEFPDESDEATEHDILSEEKRAIQKEFLDSIKNRVRLHLLSAWFEYVNQSLLERPVHHSLFAVKKDEDTYACCDRALIFLTMNKVERAAHILMAEDQCCALNQKPLKQLALSVCSSASSSVNGSPLNHEPHYRQLCEWQRTGQYTKISLPMLRIYHVLAGCIDQLVAERTMYWTQLFALLFWYPSPNLSLYMSPAPAQETLEKQSWSPSRLSSGGLTSRTSFLKRQSSSKGLTLKEQLSSKSVRRDCNDHSYESTDESPPIKLKQFGCLERSIQLYDVLLRNSTHALPPVPTPIFNGPEKFRWSSEHVEDPIYNLLKFRTHGLSQLQLHRFFELSAYSKNQFDSVSPWFLFQMFSPILKRLLEEKTAVDRENLQTQLREIRTKLDYIFVEQLVSLNLWHWAILLLYDKINALEGKSDKHALSLGYKLCEILQHNLTIPTSELTAQRVKFIYEAASLPSVVFYHFYAQCYAVENDYFQAAKNYLDAFFAFLKDTCSAGYESLKKDIFLNCSGIMKRLREQLSLRELERRQAPENFVKILVSSLLMTPTSYFLYSVCSLQQSKIFFCGVQKLCSYLLGNPYILSTLSHAPVGQVDYKRKRLNLPDIDVFFQSYRTNEKRSSSDKNDSSDDNDSLNMFESSYLVHELCLYITDIASKVLGPEWEYCPVHTLCRFVLWSGDIFRYFQSEEDDESTLMYLINELHHLVTILNQQLQHLHGNLDQDSDHTDNKHGNWLSWIPERLQLHSFSDHLGPDSLNNNEALLETLICVEKVLQPSTALLYSDIDFKNAMNLLIFSKCQTVDVQN